MSYVGDFRLGDTFDVKFTTVSTIGAPTTLAGTPVVSAYLDNNVTQLTAGITLTVDFDGLTGMHNVRVVATSGNGYATATNYSLVITTGTVGGTSVIGYVISEFSIENRSCLMPTVVDRTLDVSAGGEAGVDWANVGSQSTSVTLSSTTVSAVSGAVGSVTGNVTGSVGSIATGGIAAASFAAGAINAAAIADAAIDAATFAAGAINAAAIADAAIDAATFAAGAITSSTFAAGAINAAAIADSAIDAATFAAGAIDAAAIANSAIDAATFAAGAVDAAAIANAAIDAATFASDTNNYQAKVWLIDDNAAGTPTDRHVAVWFKNGSPITSGITSPTIQVIQVSDGSDLIASSAMTQIASLGMYKYDATTTERVVDGAHYIIKIEATIDSATRTWYQPIGRDS